MTAEQRESAPRISVVLPVRNEERHLRETLEALIEQEFPKRCYEVIVVDGQSTDATREISAEYARRHPTLVRVFPNPAQIVSAGRNIGVAQARGEVIAFVEGHARVERDFLATIERDFADSGAQCLARYVDQFFAEDNWVQRATALARRTFIGHNPHSGRFGPPTPGMMSPLGVAAVYRRAVLKQAGGYDERYTTNEDVELNWRIERSGGSAYRSGRLIYHLHPRDSLAGLLHQMINYGRGKRRFVGHHRDALRLAYVIPTVIVASAALAVPAWLIHPLAGAPVALPGAAYLLAAIGAGVSAARRGLGYLVSVPLALAVIALGFGIGFALGPGGNPPPEQSHPGGP